jgi:hypothetical protein
MVQGKRFCTSCGAALTTDDRFCGSCGKPLAVNAPTPPAPVPPVYQTPPVYQAPPVQPVAPPAYTEAIYGAIPAVSRRKGLGVEGFNVIVTQRRMIFAVMTNEMISQAAKQAGKEGGFFGGMLNAATVGYTFYKRYLTMAPDAALAENPQNFTIELGGVRKVKVTEGNEIKTYASIKANQGSIIKQHRYENGKLEIETVGQRYSFDLPGSSVEMALETLQKAGLY